MSEQRPERCGPHRRAFLGAAGTAGAVGLSGCLVVLDSGPSDAITVFHAGSLATPFKAVESAFESEYDIAVSREAQGSVGSTKKITDQGKTADVLGVSDFRLLRDMLVPEYGNWYAIFVTNAMTIAYTANSRAAGEVGPGTWWTVLARNGVSWGHSDPAVDPNGYRSVMSMQLGATEFRGDRLYGQDTYERLRERKKVPSGTESDLIGQLHSGKLDYAWEYMSVEANHNVQVVDLQPAVDLSKATAKYAKHYATAEVETPSGTFTGAPIAYGITVPSVAENPEGGAKWVEFVTGGEGQRLMTDSGFKAVEPAVVPAGTEDAVPDRVLTNARASQRLGPLQL